VADRNQLFLGFSGLLFLVNLYLIFLYAPTERVMGNVQRLFYFHVPSVWVGFLAFFIVFVASIAYLLKRDPVWDRRAYAAGEVGVVFLTVAIVTGAIWAKPVWGVWWVWDPKLTTTFILWIIYIGYMMVRAYAPSGERGARWAAVVGIVGFVDVPIVYYASELWRSLHPELVTGPFAATGGLETAMRVTLYFSAFAFTLVFVYLFRERIAQRRDEDTLAELRRAAS
jgi:heme exporter protein C